MNVYALLLLVMDTPQLGIHARLRGGHPSASALVCCEQCRCGRSRGPCPVDTVLWFPRAHTSGRNYPVGVGRGGGI